MKYVSFDLDGGVKVTLYNIREFKYIQKGNSVIAEYEDRGLRLEPIMDKLIQNGFKTFILYDYKGGISVSPLEAHTEIQRMYGDDIYTRDKDSLVLYDFNEDIKISTKESRKKTTYKEYLASNAWDKRRRRTLQIANYKCQHCGSKEKLQVHHKTYINFGNEPKEDLIALCDFCHKEEHRLNKNITKERVNHADR